MPSPTRTTASMTLALAAALVGAVLAPLGGCASDASRAPLVSAADRNKAFAPESEAYAKLGYRHVWTGFPALSGGSTYRSIDALGDVVAVQDSAGVLTVMEASSGISRWSDQLGNRLTRFLGVLRVDDRIVCCSETEAFFLDADTGTLLAKQRLEKVGTTKPEVVNDLLVYGTSAGEMYGQVMVQGFRAWGTFLPGTIVVNPGRLGNTIGFISTTGDILFLDGATGTNFARAKMFMGTRVPPAASDELMFVASEDQSLYAFSPNSAAPVWRHRTNVSLRHQPTYHDGTVYCTIPGEGLTAFSAFGDGGRGDVLWTAKDVSGSVIGLRGGRLLVWDGTDACLVDPAKGDLIDRVRLQDAAMLHVDGFIDGDIYIATKSGVIVKLAARR